MQLHLTDRPVSLPDEAIDVSIRFGDLPDSRLIAKKIAANRRLLCAPRRPICALPGSLPTRMN